MATPNFEITLDIEPISKIRCLNINCQHNLVRSPIQAQRQASCNLKHIVIGKDGKCENCEPIDK